MIVCQEHTLTQVGQSLHTLLGQQDEMRGGWIIRLQTPAANTGDVLYGNQATQLMVLDAGLEATEFCYVNLKEFYLKGSAAGQVVRIFAQSC